MAEETEVAGEGEVNARTGGRKKLIVIAGGALVLVTGIAVAAVMVLSGDEPPPEEAAVAEEAPEQPEAPPREAHYIPFEPPFVVNFQTSKSRSRYMKLEMNAVTHDPDVVAEVTRHMPAIRNSLVFLFQAKSFEELATAEAKEQLRLDSLAAVQEVLEQRIGEPGVEDLYFTNLVMQ